MCLKYIADQADHRTRQIDGKAATTQTGSNFIP
jgi:hypothetical protein